MFVLFNAASVWLFANRLYSCWHQFHAQQVETRALRLDDREETGESELQAATA